MGQAGSSATAHRPGTPRQPTPAANHMSLHIGELLEQAPESHPEKDLAGRRAALEWGDISSGAQAERRGGAGAVRGLLGGKDRAGRFGSPRGGRVARRSP